MGAMADVIFSNGNGGSRAPSSMEQTVVAGLVAGLGADVPYVMARMAAGPMATGVAHLMLVLVVLCVVNRSE